MDQSTGVLNRFVESVIIVGNFLIPLMNCYHHIGLNFVMCETIVELQAHFKFVSYEPIYVIAIIYFKSYY